MSTRGLRGEVPAASEDGMLRLGAYHLPVLGRAGGGGGERRLWPWTPPRGCCTYMLPTSAFCSFSLGGREREPLRRTLRQGKSLGQELRAPGPQARQAVFKTETNKTIGLKAVAGPGILVTQEAKAGERLCLQKKKRRGDKVGMTAAWKALYSFVAPCRGNEKFCTGKGDHRGSCPDFRVLPGASWVR